MDEREAEKKEEQEQEEERMGYYKHTNIINLCTISPPGLKKAKASRSFCATPIKWKSTRDCLLPPQWDNCYHQGAQGRRRKTEKRNVSWSPGRQFKKPRLSPGLKSKGQASGRPGEKISPSKRIAKRRKLTLKKMQKVWKAKQHEWQGIIRILELCLK